MILVNGKELDEHGLRARVKLRREHRLYTPELLQLLDEDLQQVLREAKDTAPAALYGLRRALDEEDEEKDRRQEEGSRWRRLLRAASREQEEAEAKGGAPAARDGGEEAQPSGQAGAAGEKTEKRPPLRRILAHVITVRVVQGVGEGYFQQLKQFNIFATRELEMAHRLLSSGRRGPYPGRNGRSDVWLSPRPEWGPEAIDYVAGTCGRGAVLVGIPGAALVEALWEKELLVLAVDDHGRAVAEVQARFCPATFHPRPLDLLEALRPEADLLAIPFPECLEGSQVEGLLRWAGRSMGEGGKVLLGMGGAGGRFPYEDGFVRVWPRGFAGALMEREGFEVTEWREAGTGFLVGEKKAQV